MEIPSFIQSYYPWWIGGGIFLFLIVFLRLRRQPRKIFAFETSTGRVEVARSAIVELVQTSCDQINGMKRPRIHLKVGRGGLNLTVSVRITENCRLQDYAKLLQDHLQRTLSDNLGIERLERVNLVVTSYQSGNLPALKPSSPSKPPAASPVSSSSEKSLGIPVVDSSQDAGEFDQGLSLDKGAGKKFFEGPAAESLDKPESK